MSDSGMGLELVWYESSIGLVLAAYGSGMSEIWVWYGSGMGHRMADIVWIWFSSAWNIVFILTIKSIFH